MRIQLELSDEMAIELDARRGEVPRVRWIRQAIAESLSLRIHEGFLPPQDPDHPADEQDVRPFLQDPALTEMIADEHRMLVGPDVPHETIVDADVKELPSEDARVLHQFPTPAPNVLRPQRPTPNPVSPPTAEYLEMKQAARRIAEENCDHGWRTPSGLCRKCGNQR